jgi:hypothetical protein
MKNLLLWAVVIRDFSVESVLPLELGLTCRRRHEGEMKYTIFFILNSIYPRIQSYQ